MRRDSTGAQRPGSPPRPGCVGNRQIAGLRISRGWRTWPDSSASANSTWLQTVPAAWAGRRGRLGGFVGKGVAVVLESRWMRPVFVCWALVRLSPRPYFAAAFRLSSWVPKWHFVYDECRSVFIWFGHQGLMFYARGCVEFVL